MYYEYGYYKFNDHVLLMDFIIYFLGPFGLPVGYMMREHTLPWKMNSSYRKMLRHRFATGNSDTVKRFMARYMAKIASYERWDRM